MPMRATTVRFAESLWTRVEQEAEREGVSAAQFIRDASVMRTAYAMGRRGDPDVEAVLGHLGAASEAGANGNGNGAARRGGGADEQAQRGARPAGAARGRRRGAGSGAPGRAGGDRRAGLRGRPGV